MTDARDELAELIRKAGWDAQDSPDYEKCGFDSDLFIADAILAAGWIKRHRALPICAPFDHIMYVSCAICGETPEDAAYDRP